jgi:hypothetical protein
VWIHARTSKIIALDHTVGPSGAIASRIEDVVNALAIHFA